MTPLGSWQPGTHPVVQPVPLSVAEASVRSAGSDDQPDDQPEAAVAVVRNALRKWEKAHAFALSPPYPAEEFPADVRPAGPHRRALVFPGFTRGGSPSG
ncbi:hypothetical protein [Streptomyces naphthomycinicus]|uniref:hypothetical protein n=1 Tax=Streptomyces naphthomycinicus TaxID=2872625 RepID=UPI001CEE065B|nr:hypothetical protein [Streptomyces sp. TML10]